MKPSYILITASLILWAPLLASKSSFAAATEAATSESEDENESENCPYMQGKQCPIKNQNEHECEQGCDYQERHWGGHHWGYHSRMPLVVTLSARYYSLNTSGYSNAFTGAGVNSPKTGSVGMDFSFYFQTPSQWQIGLGFGSTATSNSSGASSANYSANLYGFWFAKEFQLGRECTISIGNLLAYGDANLQVITTGISGSTDETSFTIEPKLTASHIIAPWLKLGLSVSYIEPLSQSQSITGNTLNNGNISLHGFSGGVELAIGRFGGRFGAPFEHPHE